MMLPINHIMQPDGSRLCGQACVAMVLGITLDDAIELFGSRAGTYPGQVAKVLSDAGCIVGPMIRLANEAWRIPHGIAIVNIKHNERTGGHWVVSWAGVWIFDPGETEPQRLRYSSMAIRQRAGELRWASAYQVERR